MEQREVGLGGRQGVGCRLALRDRKVPPISPILQWRSIISASSSLSCLEVPVTWVTLLSTGLSWAGWGDWSSCLWGGLAATQPPARRGPTLLTQHSPSSLPSSFPPNPQGRQGCLLAPSTGGWWGRSSSSKVLRGTASSPRHFF